jgi:hypothetical protein
MASALVRWLNRLTARLYVLNASMVRKQEEVREDIHQDEVADRIWDERIRREDDR